MHRVAIVALVTFIAAGTFASTARANDVAIAVSGGTLKIKGDVDANKLTLDQAALPSDQIRVTPDTTTINGVPGPVVFTEITKGLQVALGDGDDVLTLDSLAIDGVVKIALGAGSDVLTITNASFHDAARIDLGAGDNVLQFCSGGVDKSLSIKTGANSGVGHMAVCGSTIASVEGTAIVLSAIGIGGSLGVKGSKTIESVALQGLAIGQNSTIDLGGGSDALAVCGNAIGHTLGVTMGNGSGTFVAASCDSSSNAAGENALVVSGCAIGANFTAKMSSNADDALLKGDAIGASGHVDLGQGDNTLAIDGSAIPNLSAKSGKGNDTVTINNTGITDATIIAGAGNNSITFTGASHVDDDLTVKTGSGDDTIDLTGVTITGKTKITHGGGTDTITP